MFNLEKREWRDNWKALESNKIEIIPIKLDSPIPLLPVTVSGTICVCPTELYEGFFVA